MRNADLNTDAVTPSASDRLWLISSTVWHEHVDVIVERGSRHRIRDTLLVRRRTNGGHDVVDGRKTRRRERIPCTGSCCRERRRSITEMNACVAAPPSRRKYGASHIRQSSAHLRVDGAPTMHRSSRGDKHSLFNLVFQTSTTAV